MRQVALLTSSLRHSKRLSPMRRSRSQQLVYVFDFHASLYSQTFQVKCCLEERLLGTHTDIEFEHTTYKETFHEVMQRIEDITNHPWHGAKFQEMCKTWARRGMSVTFILKSPPRFA